MSPPPTKGTADGHMFTDSLPVIQQWHHVESAAEREVGEAIIASRSGVTISPVCVYAANSAGGGSLRHHRLRILPCWRTQTRRVSGVPFFGAMRKGIPLSTVTDAL